MRSDRIVRKRSPRLNLRSSHFPSVLRKTSAYTSQHSTYRRRQPDMARIRTIKPDFFRHEGLFEAERETGFPMRVAYAGLWTVADREGRFRWRPRQIKLDVLPFDDIDFSRVLDAFVTRGFIVKYEVAGEVYGCIPSWNEHQAINNREVTSEIPSPEKASNISDGCTRDSRVNDASATPLMRAPAEGEGEGERKGKKEQSSLRSDCPGDDDGQNESDPAARKDAKKAARIRQIAEDARAAYNAILAKPHGVLATCAVLNKPRLKAIEKALPTARELCKTLYDSERITPEFWEQYFGEAAEDEFHSGRLPGGKGHENWKPDFEYLLRENVMAKLFDRAMSNGGEDHHG